MTEARPDAALEAALERAQRQGWIGSGAMERHIRHARAFATLLPEPCDRAVDIGSGGGLPGLVLAHERPATRWTLIDSAARRVEGLIRSVRELGLGSRVEVVHGRAERLAHEPRFRESFDAAVARSFGPPAVIAEIAAGLVVPGGRVVVSDPPDAPADRWPTAPLAALALRAVPAAGGSGADERGAVALSVLEKTGPAPESVPRVTAALYRRPRW